MGTTKETSHKKVFDLEEKIVNMRSEIIISLLLGLAICLVEVKGQCECTTRTVKTNTGATLGNCETGDYNDGPDKGRLFCYVKGKYGVDDCCEEEYEEEEEEEEEEEDIEEDDKTEDITDPRTAT